MKLIVNLSLIVGTVILNGYIGVNSSYRYGIIPSGGTFSIWGIIYSWLSLSILQYANTWSNLDTLYFFISCIGNVSWLYFWSQNNIKMGIFSLFILPASLLLLWNSILNSPKKGGNLVLNSIALYAGWTIGAFLLNIYIYTTEEKKKGSLNSFFKNINLEEAAITFFCLAQILWQVYGFFKNKKQKKFFEGSIAIPLVGIWTSLGIINNGKNVKKLGYIYLVTSLLSLLHHYYNIVS
jgi:hypothetical protein